MRCWPRFKIGTACPEVALLACGFLTGYVFRRNRKGDAMSVNGKLVALTGAFALLAAPLFGAAAETGSKTHHRHFLNKARGCPVRQIADGSLVDCRGWRKWSGSIGWDNTCFDLDYLPSEFACSSSRGGRR